MQCQDAGLVLRSGRSTTTSGSGRGRRPGPHALWRVWIAEQSEVGTGVVDEVAKKNPQDRPDEPAPQQPPAKSSRRCGCRPEAHGEVEPQHVTLVEERPADLGA